MNEEGSKCCKHVLQQGQQERGKEGSICCKHELLEEESRY
jgi:hypothetical protein